MAAVLLALSAVPLGAAVVVARWMRTIPAGPARHTPDRLPVRHTPPPPDDAAELLEAEALHVATGMHLDNTRRRLAARTGGRSWHDV